MSLGLNLLPGPSDDVHLQSAAGDRRGAAAPEALGTREALSSPSGRGEP